MNVEKIQERLNIYEANLVKLREVFMEDGVIDEREQKELDKLEATIKEVRAQLNGSSGPQMSSTSSEPPKKLLFEDKALRYQTPEFIEKVKEVCKRLGMEPDFLMATMSAECGFNHKAVNKHTRATGLIQFMPFTAEELGTTVEAIGKMSGVQQLDYVERYFKKFGKKLEQISEPAESYLFVFYPYAVGKPDSYVLGSQVSDKRARLIARQNGIYDLNKDGVITKGEIMEYMRKNKYKDVYANWDGNVKDDGSDENSDDNTSDDVTIRSISASVGHRGKNDKEDTKIIQKLLNDNGASLTVDGLCGKGTINAIGKFQRDKMGVKKPDGRVDPDGRTWNALKDGAKPVEDDTSTETSDETTDNTSSDTTDNPTPTPVSIRPINASVGHKGKNDREDTKIVQKLLNDNGASLDEDGLCGRGTINAIGKFQRDKMGMRKPDGRVDPNGRTWKALTDGASSSDTTDNTTTTDDTNTDNTTTDDTTTDDTNVDTTPVDIRPITQSVGKGGKNLPEEVKIIQTLLNNYGNKLATNGVCDSKVEAAIATFQAQRLGTRKPDGRVDPNGGTWKGLNGEKPLKEDPLPKGMVKPNWIKIAEGEMGVKEDTSKTKHNPRVVEYHATTKAGNNDETPWCSSFVNWVMKKAGQGGTNSAMAVSWRKYGKKLDRAAYGSIAVIDWDGDGKGWKGHVGFVVGKNGSNVALLGGNQSNMVNVSNFNESKIVAYVVPSNYEVPAAAYNINGDIGSGGTDFAATR